MQIIDNSGVRLMNVHGANKDCRTSLRRKLNRYYLSANSCSSQEHGTIL